ncbi:MAG: HDIG domain-containing protein [Bacteroidales bacterium]|nr:HDIG domain-containing protein [Bacteroidales bacterium]
MKPPKIRRTFIPLIIVFVILSLIMPRTAKFGYDYRKGSPWPYETLISQFDFPLLKTEEEMLQEMEQRSERVIPYFRFSEEVVNTVQKNLSALDLSDYPSVKQAAALKISEIYSRGVISDSKLKLDKGSEAVSTEVLYIQKNKRVSKHPYSEVYKVSDAREKLSADLSRQFSSVNVDSLLKKRGVPDIIVPNLIFDKSMTELSFAEFSDQVSPTSGYISADRKIVSKGEIVTPEIAQMLDSYKAEYNKVFGYDGPRILLYIGNVLMALALVVILYFCIFFTNPNIFRDWNRYLYLLTIFLLSSVAAFTFEKINPDLLYLVPFSVFALYLMAFFSTRVVIPVYILSLLPLLIFSSGGAELFVIYLIGGVISLSSFKSFGRGWLQFVHALIVFLVQIVVYSAFRFIDAGSASVLRPAVFLFLGSMLSVAAYPLIYLFEKIFNLVSTTRLRELADTNNRLLQQLSAKAPGTFQHCLQVMNMADAAARSLDANVPLIRAGALYHDLGKMKNPLCFIENESTNPGAEGYHSSLTPRESARDIIRHVPDGIEIARAEGLPQVIQDFILTHHGTTCTKYFYTKYLNEGGDPAETSDFFYPGRKPTSKEQIILMVCDSVEAASRTLKSYTPEAFDKFVEDIVAGKMEEGQFENADISIREITTLKSVLKTYLSQIYHERVEYPHPKN